ncbi:MAG: hypothetical protein IKW31_02360, partial [Alistipes sp.]|nr:hypothetical protein [Alistipes sp.]
KLRPSEISSVALAIYHSLFLDWLQFLRNFSTAPLDFRTGPVFLWDPFVMITVILIGAYGVTMEVWLE